MMMMMMMMMMMIFVIIILIISDKCQFQPNLKGRYSFSEEGPEAALTQHNPMMFLETNSLGNATSISP